MHLQAEDHAVSVDRGEAVFRGGTPAGLGLVAFFFERLVKVCEFDNIIREAGRKSSWHHEYESFFGLEESF